MKALIYEPAHSGHRLHYVRVLTQGLLDLGVEVTWALSTTAPESDEFAVHLAGLSSQVTITSPTSGLPGGGYKAWKQVGNELIQEVGRRRPDRVFLPYTGGLPLALGSRLRPWPFPDIALEGLVMRGGWSYPQPSTAAALRQKLVLATIRRVPWTRLHILDPLPYFWMKQHGKLDPKRHVLIPEPVEAISQVPKVEARAKLGLPIEGRWAVVVGQQDARKGSDRLLQAFLNADTPNDANLLLAGSASEAIRQWTQTQGKPLIDQGKLHLIDRYLSDEELDLAVNASDMMVAPHFRPVGSSGLLVRAAALQKPTLATDYGWVGWATKNFNLGYPVNIEDPTAYADAMRTVFNQPIDFGNERTADFVRYHTFENHLAHWLAATRDALGLPTADNMIHWSSLNFDGLNYN